MLCNICLNEIEKNKEVKVEEHAYPQLVRVAQSYLEITSDNSKSHCRGYSGYLCKNCYEELLMLKKLR